MIAYLIGDVHDRLAQLHGRSVDLAIYSPPFLQLREYLDRDHPLKEFEHGSETSPAEFIDCALEVVASIGRVLTDRGSLCVELGDTSSGSGGAGGDYRQGGLRDGAPGFSGAAAAARSGGVDPKHKGRKRSGGESPSQKGARATTSGLGRGPMVPRNDGCGGPGWPLAKSLCMIPEAFRLALAYGFNPLNGRPSPAGQWIVRNVVSWVRTNPPPGALYDKFRRGTSTMVVATRAEDRWFDDYEVRRPLTEPGRIFKRTKRRLELEHRNEDKTIIQNPVGAPPLDWWLIPSTTYRSKTTHTHYAAFPEALVETPILTMCPPRVCVVCGFEPRRRLKPTDAYAQLLGESIYPKQPDDPDRMLHGKAGGHSKDIVADYEHDGWDECDCAWPDKYRAGVVLDPYAGTGTSLVVAARLGRDAIGIDLDARNLDIAAERLGSCEKSTAAGYLLQ